MCGENKSFAGNGAHTVGIVFIGHWEVRYYAVSSHESSVRYVENRVRAARVENVTLNARLDANVLVHGGYVYFDRFKIVRRLKTEFN